MTTRHRKHSNPFTFRDVLARPDYEIVFGRRAPLEVEIGFGKGKFLIELATARGEVNFVGLEIRQFLVERMIHQATKLGIKNIHAVHCNANTALAVLFAPQEVQRFYVHFPDPWFKTRHHKRRVINLQTAESMWQLLMPHGEVHVMTDYLPIARDAQSALTQNGFELILDQEKVDDLETTAIRSEREEWHLSQGDPVHRMSFRKLPTMANHPRVFTP